MICNILRILAPLAIVGLLLVAYFANSILNADTSYDIAKQSFESFAKHQGIAIGSFDAPPRLVDSEKSRLVTFVWRSTKSGTCSIEVDVDRRDASTHPRFDCGEATK